MRPFLLATVCLVLASCSGPAIAADAPAEERWSGHVTWTGVRVVPEGATVRVEPGATIQGGESLLVRGTLLAEGAADAPIVLHVPVAVERATAAVTLAHVQFEGIGRADGRPALSVEAGHADVRDARFVDNAAALAVRGPTASARVERTLFDSNGAAEVPRDDGTPTGGRGLGSGDAQECATLDGYTHCGEDAAAHTLEKGPGYVCFVLGERVSACGYALQGPTALVADGASASFVSVTFRSNAYALTLREAGEVLVEASAFEANSFGGITVDREAHDLAGWEGNAEGTATRLTVLNSTFTGTAGPVGVGGLPAMEVPYAVGLHGGAARPALPDAAAEAYEFRGNRFEANHVAVLVEGARRQPLFEENRYVANHVAIAAYDAAGTFRKEDVRDSVLHDVYIDGSTGQLDLRDSHYDPRKVRVEGEASVRTDWGIITAASSAALLLALGVAVALTEGGRYAFVRLLLAVPFAARLVRPQVADQTARRRLIDGIRSDPGIHLRGLAVASNVAYGAAVYHLHVLEREGYVRSRRDGLHRRFYVNGEEARAAPRLANVEVRLLDEVRARPGITQKEAGDALGISKQLAHYHATRLEESNLVERRREGRNVALHPSDEARAHD